MSYYVICVCGEEVQVARDSGDWWIAPHNLKGGEECVGSMLIAEDEHVRERPPEHLRKLFEAQKAGERFYQQEFKEAGCKSPESQAAYLRSLKR
jgi:ribonucleotide reductase beta subunit family protein with ferritin-like domain